MNTLPESEVRRAEQLLAAGDEKSRWDGAELLGEFVDSSPDLVWPALVRFGCSDDEDVRAAISTCVLEHLLQYHFERYFPEVEQLVRANRQFADTFSTCWAFGETELPQNKARFDALKEEATQTV